MLYITVIIYYILINFRHQFQQMHQTWYQYSRRTRHGTSTADAPDVAPAQQTHQAWHQHSRHTRRGPSTADAPDMAPAHQHQHKQRQQLLALGAITLEL